MVEVIPFRPPALRNTGHRVDVHDFVRVWLVVVWQGRSVLSQRDFPEKDDAEAYARAKAMELDCSVIHHRNDMRGQGH